MGIDRTPIDEHLFQHLDADAGLALIDPTRAAVAAAPQARQLPLRGGDLCPDCGHAALVNEEGCRKCYSCGFSQC